MNVFKKVKYDSNEITTSIAYEMSDYVVYQRTNIDVMVNRHFLYDVKPTQYTKEFVDNLIENIEQSTILNSTTINVLFKDNFTKLFANNSGKIYAIDIVSNMLTDDLYRAIMDIVKFMVNHNTDHFDDLVYVNLTFSPIGDK